jgi:hypothetical protein
MMNKFFIIAGLVLLFADFCSGQKYDSLHYERYLLNDNDDTIRIFHLSGSLNQANTDKYAYGLFLYNSYGNYFKQWPLISFLDSVRWNHDNVCIESQKGKNGNYREITQVIMIKLLKSDRRSLRFLKKRLNTNGFDELALRAIQRRCKFEFMPYRYGKIDFSKIPF